MLLVERLLQSIIGEYQSHCRVRQRAGTVKAQSTSSQTSLVQALVQQVKAEIYTRRVPLRILCIVPYDFVQNLGEKRGTAIERRMLDGCGPILQFMNIWQHSGPETFCMLLSLESYRLGQR